MPIYEYECDTCSIITESFQSISDDPLTSCPKCDGALKKLISPSSFQLKGGGWYADGYGNTKSAPSKTSESTPVPPKTDSSKACKKNTAKSCPCAS
jgi:putative FmdB family regulatory protein